MNPFRWFQAISNCAWREVKALIATPAEVIFCGILPLLWILFVWGLLGNGIMTNVPVGFVDYDKTQMTRTIGNALDASRAIGLESFNTKNEALAAMREGSVYGVIVIPQSYTKDMVSGKGSSIIAYLDENRYAVAGTLNFDIAGVLQALNLQNTIKSTLYTGSGIEGAKRLVSVVHSDFNALGNMQYSFLSFLGSNLIPGIIALCAILCFVTSIIREDYSGTIENWFETAEGSVSAAILGKMAPHFFYYCLVFAAYIALFTGFGGFRPAGSLAIWFICAVACLMVLAAMSVLIVAISPTWRFALVVTSGYAAPALPFTGFSIPMASMGPVVKLFCKCLPLTWFIEGQSQQWTIGASLSEMGTTFTAFAILFVLPALIGLPLFKRAYSRREKKQQELALREVNNA